MIASSFNIFEFGRRLWVVLQSCLIYWWIYKGFKYYRAVQSSFMRAQWVLTMQFGIVTYVLINEFVYKNIVGIFLLLAFAHYVNFLTFTLVVDSCQTKQMDQKLTKGRVINTVFRVLMRIPQILFVCIAIWGPRECVDYLYPWTFLVLIWTIVLHQVYDIFLYNKNYFVKLDNMPPMSSNRLRFNKDLFKAQTKCLFIINIIFGVVSTVVVLFSYAFIQDGNGIFILCYNTNQWEALNFMGTIFIGAHQLLIMMQIKMSQQVLIKIPASMDLFAQNVQKDAVFKSVRNTLVKQLLIEKTKTTMAG